MDHNSDQSPQPKRVIEGYTETLCIPFAGRETVLAENQNEKLPYLVCSVKWDNPLGAEERYDGIVTDDYTEAMREVVKRVGALVSALETEREDSGRDIQRLTADYCLPDSMSAAWEGKVAIVRLDALAPEYKSAENQLILCTGGNGAKPNARGQSVFAQELFSGKKMRYERRQIAGLADPAKMPEWAVTKLAELMRERELERERLDSPAQTDKKPSLLGNLNKKKETVERGKGAGGKDKTAKRKEKEVGD